jgi:hypothetical protein
VGLVLNRALSQSPRSMLRPLPDSDLVLTPAQKAALAHVRDGAAALPTTGEPGAALSRARVSLNFHPDRLAADGRLVIEALRDDGLYRNQFESRVSNGALSAHPGGARDQWEARLFGDAYHAPPAAAHERPKYGALDLLRFPDGPAPRFGSCHLRLRPAVLARSTLCFGDSHLGPTDLGTLDEPDAVLAGLVEALHATGSALGHSGTLATPPRRRQAETARGRVTRVEPGRTLDEYIEVQVHGPVRPACDVEALVADPAFRETDIGAASGGDERSIWPGTRMALRLRGRGSPRAAGLPRAPGDRARRPPRHGPAHRDARREPPRGGGAERRDGAGAMVGLGHRRSDPPGAEAALARARAPRRAGANSNRALVKALVGNARQTRPG